MGGMLKLPTSDPEEGEVRATVPHEVPALSPTVRAGRQIPITCISVLAVVSAAVAASFIYLKPWSFELPAASPYMGFQEKEMQCHDSCHVHDVANSHCRAHVELKHACDWTQVCRTASLRSSSALAPSVEQTSPRSSPRAQLANCLLEPQNSSSQAADACSKVSRHGLVAHQKL